MIRDEQVMFQKTNDLILSAQGGDRESLNALFERYFPQVRLIVALRMGCAPEEMSDMEDLVQEALLKTLNSLDRFEARSEGGFRNWLSSCVQSVVADERRRVRAKKRGGGRVKRFSELCNGDERLCLQVLGPAKGPGASTLLAVKELNGKVYRALMELPPHYREVIILARICEMPLPEVAKTLELSPGNIRVILFRALKKLRGLLQIDE